MFILSISYLIWPLAKIWVRCEKFSENFSVWIWKFQGHEVSTENYSRPRSRRLLDTSNWLDLKYHRCQWPDWISSLQNLDSLILELAENNLSDQLDNTSSFRSPNWCNTRVYWTLMGDSLKALGANSMGLNRSPSENWKTEGSCSNVSLVWSETRTRAHRFDSRRVPFVSFSLVLTFLNNKIVGCA